MKKDNFGFDRPIMLLVAIVSMAIIILVYLHLFEIHKIFISAGIALVYSILLVLLVNMVIESIPEITHLSFI